MDTFHDLETRSPVPIKNGSHAYAEKAEVMLWAYAGEQGEPRVWDLINDTDNYLDELADVWVEEPLPSAMPPLWLDQMLHDPQALYWVHNGGMFDFVVLDRRMPELARLMPHERRRDTMVQAYCCAMPGSLDKLGAVMGLGEDEAKLADEGKRLIRLFCIPRHDGKYNGKDTHPEEWARFIRYAARDITTMRVVRQKLPQWNYREGKQMDLWRRHLAMTNRGMFVDQDLAAKAMAAATKAKAEMADRVSEITDGTVTAATQRDRLLTFILGEYGVDLPDMKSDTIERRLEDPELPDAVKELLRIRLRASMNSSSKYRTLLHRVSRDGRLRGCSQFRGAGRTGRTAHRGFQPGNLPRPAYKWNFIKAGIAATKADCLDLVVDNEMEMCGSMIRGTIIAAPGKKLVVADLSNIEGRMAAWLAGEEWKLDAFRAYDTVIPGEKDAKGKPKRKGSDLYVKAYCSAFNVEALSDDPHEAFLQRQIGKVMELMFQYEGGVGAWLTGAATYGIDLAAMTEAVYDTLPLDVVAQAESFLDWRFECAEEPLRKALNAGKIDAEQFEAKLAAAKEKVLMGLAPKVFITCETLKRLWRRAHEAISSYWPELKNTVIEAIQNPGTTLTARKLKIRRDGTWLRIGLPSGRALCYPQIGLSTDGRIFYTGQDPYKKTWGRVYTYGGKLFENVVQAVANDQFMEPLPAIEAAGFEPVLDVHDEWVCEADEDRDDLSAARLAELMTMDLGWNAGLPLAAAGFETDRYHKED